MTRKDNNKQAGEEGGRLWDAKVTFLDMREMSMLSFPAQPEMYTVESGSESSLPLKEHRVAWRISIGIEIAPTTSLSEDGQLFTNQLLIV